MEDAGNHNRECFNSREDRLSSPATPSPETADPGGGGGGGGEGGGGHGEKDGGADSRDRRLDGIVDGPWAWVVTAATFFIHFILYGFIFVAGMYFVVFLETFGRSSSMTSWISSLYLGTLCSTGGFYRSDRSQTFNVTVSPYG